MNHGLFDLDLHIKQGEVFGFIGPNGAGKSTFIKLLMGLIRPTRGEVSIFGLDSQQDGLEIMKITGYLPGELMLFPNVTSRYILELMMNLRKNRDFSFLIELADRLDLDLDRKYQDLSHGNKQKVAVIQAMMHRPQLLILDEPTLGLDPIIQREFRRLIQEFSESGNTVLISSHVLSEVQSICSRIGLIHEGHLVKEGVMEDLRSTKTHILTVTFARQIPDTENLRIIGVREIERLDHSIIFHVEGNLNPLIGYLSGFDVINLTSRELSLEEVFFFEIQK